MFENPKQLKESAAKVAQLLLDDVLPAVFPEDDPQEDKDTIKKHLILGYLAGQIIAIMTLKSGYPSHSMMVEFMKTIYKEIREV